MSIATESGSIAIVAISPADGREVCISVSQAHPLRHVLRVAARALGMPETPAAAVSLQLRREGQVLALDVDQTVVEAIASGDRLILEKIAAPNRMGDSTVEEDGFTAAAANVAAQSLSPDSGTFLRRAGQVSGE